MKRWLLLLAALSTPAAAAPISVARSATAAADLLGALNPWIMPGSTIEYMPTVQNPLLIQKPSAMSRSATIFRRP